MLLFLCYILLFINAYAQNEPQPNCIKTVISYSCEKHNALSIENEDICRRVVNKFVGRELTAVRVHPTAQWRSQPSCYYDDFTSYFNKRDKMYYNLVGELYPGQGQCTKHAPCLCLVYDETCPEDHKITENMLTNTRKQEKTTKKHQKTKKLHRHHNLW